MRHLLILAAFLAPLWLGSCSSSEEEDAGELEAAGENGDVAAENVAANAEAENVGEDVANAASEAGEEASGNEALTQMENGAGQNPTAEVPIQNATAEGDLKEIISEMNANTAQESGDPKAGTEAAEVPAAVATAPAPAEVPAQTGGSTLAGLPEMGSKMPYVVEHGDTLGKIAQKIYGNQGKWKDIAQLSSLSNPSRIYPGDVIYYALEEGSMAFAKTYDTVTRAKEIAQPGDTLAKIAKRVYGTSRSWKHIWRQNDAIDNPDKLEAGTAIYYIKSGAISAGIYKMLKSKIIKTASVNVSSQHHQTVVQLFSLI